MSLRLENSIDTDIIGGMKNMATEKLYDTNEAAEVLGVTAIRVRQLCQEGRIGVSVGNQWVIGHAELMAFKRKRRKAGRPKSVA